MRRLLRSGAVLAAAVGLLLVAAPAFAHVTVRVDDASPGAYAEYTLRVPNESDSAATTSVEVQLPEGFEPLVAPVAGWEVAVDGGVMTVSGGAIAPGQYQDFTFVAQNPEDGGEARFAAIQTYDDGEVAEWVGDEEADFPASVVTFAAGEADAAAAASDGGAAASGGGANWLGIAGLVAGLAGLALGGLAYARSTAAARPARA